MPPSLVNSVCLSGLYLATLVGLVGILNWWPALFLVPPLVWLSVTDMSRFIIPDTACVFVAVFGLFCATGEHIFFNVMVAGGIFAITAWVGQVYWDRHGREALGLGDAKLLAAGALVVGPGGVWTMLILATAGGIATTVLWRNPRDEGVPFGPFLAYAIFVTYLLAWKTE